MSKPNAPSITPDYQRDWPAYFNAVHDKPPRETLIKALELFEADPPADSRIIRTACDLACGEGRDTRELVRRGWHVLAIDSSTAGLSLIQDGMPAPQRSAVVPLALKFEEVSTVLAHTPPLDLINASFALPFCEPVHFPALWHWIVHSLRPGGRFCGQFFGDRDEWAPVRPSSHHTRAAVESFLAPFNIEQLQELDQPGGDALGGTKHHHIFHVVARKRP